jgi:hypothetical protein
MQKTKDFIKSNELLILAVFALFFIFIRFPGTDLPLHQDEYKWPRIVNPSLGSDTEIPHPPLSQFIYRTAGELVGFNVHFRFVPLFFGTINLLLLYFYMKMKWGRKTAFVGISIFTLSYFSVLASLMVDTDGQILPFFFLVALISYEKLKSIWNNKKWFWFFTFIVSILAGFFVKVSFILPISAIVADFIWSKKSLLLKNKNLVFKYIGLALAFVIFTILALVLSQKIFPFFSLAKSVTYWEHFWGTNRNWFQTFIQLVKAILYTSPFLILIPFYIPKEKLKEALPHLFYLIFGFIFYIILFDFSIGALDRYLQFIIVPLTVLTSVTLISIFDKRENVNPRSRTKEFLLLGSIVALIILKMSFLDHFVPALHPKKEWIDRILSLRWNFLYPFSGGSGPLGVYVSFLFIGLYWITSTGLILYGFFKKDYRKYILLVLIPLGLVYNLVFTEEYLFGKINGSAPKLLSNTVLFIKNNPDIKYVTVYNDNGGDEIKAIGKYRKRLYTDPAFDINEKIATLNQYKEHYLEIDVPRIDPKSIYRKYLDSCKIIYKETDQKISSTVYDCRGVGDVRI